MSKVRILKSFQFIKCSLFWQAETLFASTPQK